MDKKNQKPKIEKSERTTQRFLTLIINLYDFK